MNDLREYIYNHHLATSLEMAFQAIPGMPEEYPAYLFREKKRYGVLIITDIDYDVYQEFAGTVISSESIMIDNQEYKCLMFSCDDVDRAYMFSFSELLFIDPGENGSNRKKLITDPQSWIDDFIGMYGNTKSSKSPYDVIGELLLFEELFLTGKDPVWHGPDMSVVDVIAKDVRYDSKSTICRTESKIHISEQFQAEEVQVVAFYRFEELSSGELSLESLTNRMISEGVDETIIEKGLASLDIVDTRDLRRRYHLLEKRFYRNDEHFPKITGEFFIDGEIPGGIESLEYDVNLTDIEFERVIPDIDVSRL